MAPVNDNPLGGLIRREMQAHEDWSYRSLAAKSNGRLTRSDLTNWVANVYKRLSPEKLIALAEVLEQPLPVVVEAALATMKLDVGWSRTIEDAIAHDRTLSEIAKRRLLRAVQDERAQAAGPASTKVARRPRPDANTPVQ